MGISDELGVACNALRHGRVDALYVHVPFCAHKCHYCDFYSITRQSSQRMELFVNHVLAEARGWTAKLPDTQSPRTIFFGGGTPSLLPLESMQRLITGLRSCFDLSRVEEWTIEVNPATASAPYLHMLREAGVDRLSFGAQSFDRRELVLLERHHEPDDVARSLELARSAGFSRLNLDLIFAIPGQSLAQWMASLEQAIELRTPHLSCYGLTYEPNTPLAVRKRLGQVQPVEEELELEMLHSTRQRLATAGFAAYEISNFAIPGEACRHNLLYWTGGNYLGLGPAAASHVDGVRWRNRPHLGEWESAVSQGRVPFTDLESLSPRQRQGELAMLMLRLDRGLNFADFSARMGCDARSCFADPIDRLTRLGLLEQDATRVRLTQSGLRVADAVAAEFVAHTA